MKKFKYLKISKTKKLRYIDNYYKKKLYIIILPGFMSDIDGSSQIYRMNLDGTERVVLTAVSYAGQPNWQY